MCISWISRARLTLLPCLDSGSQAAVLLGLLAEDGAATLGAFVGQKMKPLFNFLDITRILGVGRPWEEWEVRKLCPWAAAAWGYRSRWLGPEILTAGNLSALMADNAGNGPLIRATESLRRRGLLKRFY